MAPHGGSTIMTWTTLSGANTARPAFTPDIAGSYVFCLTVNDGQSGDWRTGRKQLCQWDKR